MRVLLLAPANETASAGYTVHVIYWYETPFTRGESDLISDARQPSKLFSKWRCLHEKQGCVYSMEASDEVNRIARKN